MNGTFCIAVVVPVYSKNNGRRNYSKKDICYYCEKTINSRISKHYLSVHTDRTLVQQVISADGEAERNDKLYQLQHMGNFKHNTKV